MRLRNLQFRLQNDTRYALEEPQQYTRTKKLPLQDRTCEHGSPNAYVDKKLELANCYVVVRALQDEIEIEKSGCVPHRKGKLFVFTIISGSLRVRSRFIV